MSKCPYCGMDISADDKFCAHCGSKIPDPSAQQTPTFGTDDSRFYHGSLPGILGQPATDFSGYAKWTADEIHSMSSSQLISMLLEIRITTMRRSQMQSKVTDLQKEHEIASSHKKPYQKQVIPFMCLSLVSLLLFLLCAWNSSNLAILGFFLFISFSIPFIIFISKQKAVMKARKERLPKLRAELEQTIADMRQDVIPHGDAYISAMVALPAYWDNAAAVDYLIVALQNHRAQTLGEAINLFEKDQNDKRLQSIMYQQLAAQRETAAAARETAYNTKVAAMATVDVSHNTRNIARSASDIERSNRKAAESAKEIAKNSEDIAQDTWAMRKGLD